MQYLLEIWAQIQLTNSTVLLLMWRVGQCQVLFRKARRAIHTANRKSWRLSTVLMLTLISVSERSVRIWKFVPDVVLVHYRHGSIVANTVLVANELA